MLAQHCSPAMVRVLRLAERVAGWALGLALDSS